LTGSQTANHPGRPVPEDITLPRAPWRRAGPDRNESSTTTPPPITRRTARKSGPIALAAACALPACGTAPPPTPTTRRTPTAASPLHTLRDAPHVIVAGERLDADLLRGFYERHDYNWVWSTRQDQADAMVRTVLRAGEHGIDPELFHASLLQRRNTFPALRRELLLSHAFLAYARALATGATPPDRRKDGEALTPGPIDIPATLDRIIAGPDPAEALEALAPATPTYDALRDSLRRHRTGPLLRARNTAERIRTLEANLERQRWLPRSLPADRVWVNVADQHLAVFEADEPVFTTRVIVGAPAPRRQSPEFHTLIRGGYYNPPWVIPADIVAADYLPLLERDPTFLERHDMVLRPNGEIEQRPGPNAGLGQIMFDMPNRFDVYLHDTPDRTLFNRDNRRLSYGCIRVQNPIEFAALLLKRPIEAINDGIAAGGTTHHRLPTPMPVFVTYQTAFADAAGKAAFRPDFYGRDEDLWQRMQRQGVGV
jgi:murein L,D-transpeptidase YcbB/YkuD